MKARFLIVLAVTIVVSALAASAGSLDEKGKALLFPPTRVLASINFVDDGSTLKVTGHARGMTPGQVYVSLIYDVGSTVQGPAACGLTIFDPTDPNFIIGTMLLGTWEVDRHGRGTLSAINTNDGANYVPVEKIGAVSVRRIIGPPGPGAPNTLVAKGVKAHPLKYVLAYN